jgi:hypothetical protein
MGGIGKNIFYVLRSRVSLRQIIQTPFVVQRTG